jgi:hypothetical protein
VIRAGWYETLRPDGEAVTRRTVYLAWFPEDGPCIADGGRFEPLPAAALDWRWHGPFPTRREAEDADLRRERARPHPFGA